LAYTARHGVAATPYPAGASFGGAAGGVDALRAKPWVAAQPLLVLLVAASVAGAQGLSGEIVERKTTKAEIRAFYGPPDYSNEQGDLIYDASSLKPPLPACVRGRVRSTRQFMIIFEFEDSGILVRCSTTGWPPP